MNPHHLRNDELVYELEIRHIDAAHIVAKTNQKTLLNELLAKEAAGLEKFPDRQTRTGISELEICKNKVSDLYQILTESLKKGDKEMLKYIKSRSIHTYNRCNRIKDIPDGTSEKLIQREILEKTHEFISQIETRLNDLPQITEPNGDGGDQESITGKSTTAATGEEDELCGAVGGILDISLEKNEIFYGPSSSKEIPQEIQRQSLGRGSRIPQNFNSNTFREPTKTPAIENWRARESDPNPKRNTNNPKTDNTQTITNFGQQRLAQVNLETEIRKLSQVRKEDPQDLIKSFEEFLRLKDRKEKNIPKTQTNNSNLGLFQPKEINPNLGLGLPRPVIQQNIPNRQNQGATNQQIQPLIQLNDNNRLLDRYMNADTNSNSSILQREDVLPDNRQRQQNNYNERYDQNERNIQHQRNRGCRPQNNQNNNRMYRKPKPIHQWQLNFSGEKGLSLNDFLDQVEMLARAEGFTEEDIFLSILHLLSGRAYNWYREVNTTLNSWNEFKEAIKREFLPENYDDFLRWEIDNRFQAKDESFSVYMTAMKRLFSCLDEPLTEARKVYMVRKGLQPSYAMKLSTTRIYSLEHLIDLCKQIDQTVMLINRQQRQISVPRSSLLEPDYSAPPTPYRSNKNVNTLEHNFNLESEYEDYDLCAMQHKRKFNGNVSAHNAPKREISTQTFNSPCLAVKCWNCESKGHSFRECSEPRKETFCYKCGTKKVTAASCTECKKGNSENLVAESS